MNKKSKSTKIRTENLKKAQGGVLLSSANTSTSTTKGKKLIPGTTR